MNAYGNLLIDERLDAAGDRDVMRSPTFGHDSPWLETDPFEPRNGRYRNLG